MKTTTWETKCHCGEKVYYYPQKLVLETKIETDEINMERRLVSLTCCTNCNKTYDYIFPEQFNKI